MYYTQRCGCLLIRLYFFSFEASSCFHVNLLWFNKEAKIWIDFLFIILFWFKMVLHSPKHQWKGCCLPVSFVRHLLMRILLWMNLRLTCERGWFDENVRRTKFGAHRWNSIVKLDIRLVLICAFHFLHFLFIFSASYFYRNDTTTCWCKYIV